MTDHWKDVLDYWRGIGDGSTYASVRPQRFYIADRVDAARAKDAEAHAVEVAAKDAEIARLTAQVQADAHLRSVVELYHADPMAMAEALVRMRDELGALRATHE